MKNQRATNLPKTDGSHPRRQFLQRSGLVAGALFTVGFPGIARAASANHFGNVAFRVGAKLQWDHVALKAGNCPAAEPLIHRKYRKGWRLG